MFAQIPGVDDLLNSDLIGYCTMFVLFLQFLDNKAAENKLLEGWRWVPKVVVGFGFSFLIAGIWHSYLPADAEQTLANDWRLQGLLGGVWMALWNGVSAAAYGPGRPPGSSEDARAFVAKIDPEVRRDAGIALTAPKTGGLDDA